MEEISVSIRNIQHFLYCPHRWGLINIDCSWDENYFVTKGNMIHNRVHDPDNSYVSRTKQVLTSVRVYNDSLGIYGVTDCIELTKRKDGIRIQGFPERYQLAIVEYKPRKPKNNLFNEDDAIQVFAQKLCVDSIFHCDAAGIIFYADVKKRISLPLNENYDRYLAIIRQVLDKIRNYTINGEIPPIRENQKCSGCSFRDTCNPQAIKRNRHETFLDMVKQER